MGGPRPYYPAMDQQAEDSYHAADSRCCVCTRRVSRRPSLRFDLWAGVEVDVRGRRVLLCHVGYDNAVVRGTYSADQLIEVWEHHLGEVAARRFRALTEPNRPPAIALTHPGSIKEHPDSTVLSDAPQVFVKIWNDSSAGEFSIDELWFEADVDVPVENPERPLPVVLQPGDLFETWLPQSRLSAVVDWAAAGRVRLSTGGVIQTKRNEHVPPGGFVGGGGRTLADAIAVREPGAAGVDVILSNTADGQDWAAGLMEAMDLLRLSFIAAADEVWSHAGAVRPRGRMHVLLITPDLLRTVPDLDLLVQLLDDGKQTALPIWHRVSPDEVRSASPALAEMLGLPTAVYSDVEVAVQISAALARRGR